ncbi:MAG: site-specific integrase, partial [Zoogloeaceae bacterium]|nr:site-specific integrase [Zoogloeaceae bacterium]
MTMAANGADEESGMSQAEENAALVKAYLAVLAEQRRQSPHTVKNYAFDLARLCEAAEETPFSHFDTLAVRRQIAKLHGTGLSGRSLARILSAWRGFFRWLQRTGRCENNPCLDLHPPKSPKRLPQALSVEECMALLEAENGAEEKEGDDCLSRRDQAMFELFYSSGLRLAELASLELADLPAMLQEHEVRVTGKRGKIRLVPVGEKAREALLAWETVRASMAKPEETALFVSRRGTRLGMRMIQIRLADRARARLLVNRVHP